MQARVLGAGAAAAAYVDKAQCLECHADQAQRWQQSHHAMAMAVPSARSVRGDFDGTAFTHAGVTSRFFRRDGKYFVHTDGPNGKMSDFEVRYTFGVDPLQQYLIETPGGRLQPLTIAWDTRTVVVKLSYVPPDGMDAEEAESEAFFAAASAWTPR